MKKIPVLGITLIIQSVAGLAHRGNNASSIFKPENIPSTSIAMLTALILLTIGVWIYRKHNVSLARDNFNKNYSFADQKLTNWIEKNFHRIYLFLLFFLFIGSVADIRDHIQGGLHALITFGHLVFPIAGTLILGLIGFMTYIRKKKGLSWKEAVPEGYLIAFIATPLFLLGFGLDIGWHFLFGLETHGLEVYSPPHLWLLVAALVIFLVPLRRAWDRIIHQRWRNQFSALSSTSFVLWIIFNLLWIFYPYNHVFPLEGFPVDNPVLNPSIAVMGLFIFSIILMIFLLNLVSRFEIVPGGLTYLYGLSNISMIVMYDQFYFVPTILLTGFAADVMNQWLKPSKERLLQFRIYAFLVPFIFAVLYYATLLYLGSIQYRFYVWTGSILFAGFGGLLVSYAIQPFEQRVEES